MSQVLLAVLCLDIYCLITEGNLASAYVTREFRFFGRGTEGKARVLSKSGFLLSPTVVTPSSGFPSVYLGV